MHFVTLKLISPFYSSLEILLWFRPPLRRRLEELEEQANKVAGRSFCLSSPKEVSAILFEHLKLPLPASRIKSGGFSTAAEVQTTVIPLDHVHQKHSSARASQGDCVRPCTLDLANVTLAASDQVPLS